MRCWVVVLVITASTTLWRQAEAEAEAGAQPGKQQADPAPSPDDAAAPEILALPAPEGGGKTVSLDVATGLPQTLDHLGPMIVTKDGNLRRITNWDQLTDAERKVTMRRVGKRNRERLAKLRAEAKDEL